MWFLAEPSAPSVSVAKSLIIERQEADPDALSGGSCRVSPRNSRRAATVVIPFKVGGRSSPGEEQFIRMMTARVSPANEDQFAAGRSFA